jgi:hypothetical protein
MKAPNRTTAMTTFTSIFNCSIVNNDPNSDIDMDSEPKPASFGGALRSCKKSLKCSSTLSRYRDIKSNPYRATMYMKYWILEISYTNFVNRFLQMIATPKVPTEIKIIIVIIA